MPAGRMTRVVRATGGRKRGLNFKQVKQVQKIINSNQRLKTFRASLNVGVVTTAGVLTEVSAIAEGDDFSQRDSDRIRAASLKLHGAVQGNTAVTGYTVLRIMLCRAKHGVLALADMPVGGNITDQADLDKIQVYSDRLYILHDDADGSGTAHNDIFVFKSFKNRKVPHMNIEYDDSESATLAQKNACYVFQLSNQAVNGGRFIGWTDLKFFNSN